MNVALLEIADVLDDPATSKLAGDLELHFANDESLSFGEDKTSAG